MERQKLVKRFTLGLAIVGGFSLLATSVSSIWQLAQQPATTKTVPISQDAQLTEQENGYWAVLKDEPTNKTAISGLEQIGAIHANQGNTSKSIAIFEKLRQAAPKSPKAKLYEQYLAQLKKNASATPPAQPTGSPTAKP